MSEDARLKLITRTVAKEAQTIFGNRLDRVILYGSYARGEQDRESDIDIMVLADVSKEEELQYASKFDPILTPLDLEHGTVTSLIVKNTREFEQWKTILPFYQNVLREGVVVSG